MEGYKKQRFEPYMRGLSEDFNKIGDHVIDNISKSLAAVVVGDDAIFLGLSVVETAPSPTMGVNVGGGIAIYGGGGTGVLLSRNDAEIVSVPSNSSGNTRIDIIEIREDTEEAESQQRQTMNSVTKIKTVETVNTEAIRTYEVKIKSGTPSATPVAPTVDTGWIKLAEIVVGDGVTYITDSEIYNVDAGFKGENNTGWTTEEDIIYRCNTYVDHRSNPIMDHPPGCIQGHHLDVSSTNSVGGTISSSIAGEGLAYNATTEKVDVSPDGATIVINGSNEVEVGEITGTNVQNGTIGADELAVYSVTEPKIANSAVTINHFDGDAISYITGTGMWATVRHVKLNNESDGSGNRYKITFADRNTDIEDIEGGVIFKNTKTGQEISIGANGATLGADLTVTNSDTTEGILTTLYYVKTSGDLNLNSQALLDVNLHSCPIDDFDHQEGHVPLFVVVSKHGEGSAINVIDEHTIIFPTCDPLTVYGADYGSYDYGNVGYGRIVDNIAICYHEHKHWQITAGEEIGCASYPYTISVNVDHRRSFVIVYIDMELDMNGISQWDSVTMVITSGSGGEVFRQSFTQVLTTGEAVFTSCYLTLPIEYNNTIDLSFSCEARFVGHYKIVGYI